MKVYQENSTEKNSAENYAEKNLKEDWKFNEIWNILIKQNKE